MNPNRAYSRGQILAKLLLKLIPLAIIAAAGMGVYLLAALLPEKDRDKPAKPAAPVNVTVQVIEPVEEIDETLVLHGVVAANRVVRVSAEVDGRVEGRLATRGEEIRAGQEILHMNRDLIQAEYSRDKALVDYHLAQYDQVELAKKHGVATRTQMDQATMNRDTAAAALAMSKARLDRTRILSPITGMLDTRLAETGQYLRTGDLVAEIVDTGTVKVQIYVPERDVPHIDLGDEARITFEKATGNCTVGRITRIREQADPDTRTTMMEIALPNAGGTLRAGPIVTVELTRQQHRNIIMIPLKAVIPFEKIRVVYVVENGLAKRKEVELGFMKDQSIWAKSGLKPGDRLIVAGHRYVAPDQAVKVFDPPATQPATQSASQPATTPTTAAADEEGRS